MQMLIHLLTNNSPLWAWRTLHKWGEGVKNHLHLLSPPQRMPGLFSAEVPSQLFLFFFFFFFFFCVAVFHIFHFFHFSLPRHKNVVSISDYSCVFQSESHSASEVSCHKENQIKTFHLNRLFQIKFKKQTKKTPAFLIFECIFRTKFKISVKICETFAAVHFCVFFISWRLKKATTTRWTSGCCLTKHHSLQATCTWVCNYQCKRHFSISVSNIDIHWDSVAGVPLLGVSQRAPNMSQPIMPTARNLLLLIIRSNN